MFQCQSEGWFPTNVFPKEVSFYGVQYLHEGCAHLTTCKYHVRAVFEMLMTLM